MKTDPISEPLGGEALDQVRERKAFKWHGGAPRERIEQLAVEEPLEIRLGGRRFTLTMRTPGHDEELAADRKSVV